MLKHFRSFKLGNRIFCTYTYIWTFGFLENVHLNHRLGPSISSLNILYLKEYPHNVTKYEIKETLKIPISHVFSELKKNWRCNLAYIQNNKKSLEVQPKTITQKITILNLWINLENLCPNFHATVETKIL